MPLVAAHLPLSLYIHLPWCVKKCPYCDFNSHAVRDSLPEEAYLNALLEELEQVAPRLEGRAPHSIFFGGGTPSLFSPAAIGRLLHAVERRLGLANGAEITLEANPGTVDMARFQGFRAAGVNRLSIGIQSLQDDKLKRLGRIHGRADALAAIAAAKQAGFDNFNLDLMHGLPDQTASDALADLKDALATHPTHLSWYQLTLEPNTPFHHAPPALPNEDTLQAIQTEGHAFLSAAGFHAYEVSAWSQQPRHACQHNLNYWTFGDYLGIGAGAHSKLTVTGTPSILRRAQCRHPADYLIRHKREATPWQAVPENELAFEFMLNALRLREGVAASLFEERTGQPLETIATPLHTARERGLLISETDRLTATSLGRQFLNDLTILFLNC